MASRNLGSVLGHFDQLFGPGTLAGLSERQLLERFMTQRDAEAFEAIVTRHGPMVLGVCRRWLADPHDADDAFQATFLVLVRKAESLRNRDVLASWLYGVANRVARRARQQTAARHRREAAAAVERGREEAVSTMTHPEFGPELHQEINRLPGDYKSAIVLCYLEGRTHEEAAQELGWPIGTVKGRLARARDLLRQRLVRRGVAAPAALLVAALESDAAVVAPALTSATVRAGLMMATGQTMAAGTVPAVVSELVDEVVNAMGLTKWKTLALAGSLTACTVVGGAVVLGQYIGNRGSGQVRAVGPVAGGPGMDQVQGNAQVANLQQQRLAIAKRLLEMRSDMVKQGVTTNSSMLTAARLVMEAERDIASTPAARVAATQSYIQRLEEHLAVQRARQENGSASPDAVVEAELAVVEAKIALEKELEHAAGAGASMSAGMAGAGAEMSADGVGMMASSGGGMQMASASGGAGGGMQMAMGGGMGPGGGMGGAMSGGSGGGGAGGADEELEQRVRQARPKLFRAIDEDARTQAIVAKLNEVHDFPFANETPLEDVIKNVREQTKDAQFPNGIPIYVDPAGLQVAEKTLQSTVRLELESVPIRTALRLALRQLGLVYVVKEGLLMISSPESESLLDEIEREPES